MMDYAKAVAYVIRLEKYAREREEAADSERRAIEVLSSRTKAPENAIARLQRLQDTAARYRVIAAAVADVRARLFAAGDPQ